MGGGAVGVRRPAGHVRVVFQAQDGRPGSSRAGEAHRDGGGFQGSDMLSFFGDPGGAYRPDVPSRRAIQLVHDFYHGLRQVAEAAKRLLAHFLRGHVGLAAVDLPVALGVCQRARVQGERVPDVAAGGRRGPGSGAARAGREVPGPGVGRFGFPYRELRPSEMRDRLAPERARLRRGGFPRPRGRGRRPPHPEPHDRAFAGVLPRRGARWDHRGVDFPGLGAQPQPVWELRAATRAGARNRGAAAGPHRGVAPGRGGARAALRREQRDPLRFDPRLVWRPVCLDGGVDRRPSRLPRPRKAPHGELRHAGAQGAPSQRGHGRGGRVQAAAGLVVSRRVPLAPVGAAAGSRLAAASTATRGRGGARNNHPRKSFRVYTSVRPARAGAAARAPRPPSTATREGAQERPPCKSFGHMRGASVLGARSNLYRANSARSDIAVFLFPV
mmetsp:Transcript_78275/g.239407  ORF Transcript_78275/g.239407 Transcript_78275/m.239407 type:complete len:442 (+) Transcript_78275:234-1559(+)